MISICNLPFWLLQKVNWEASREGFKLLCFYSTVHQFPSPLWARKSREDRAIAMLLQKNETLLVLFIQCITPAPYPGLERKKGEESQYTGLEKGNLNHCDPKFPFPAQHISSVPERVLPILFQKAALLPHF